MSVYDPNYNPGKTYVLVGQKAIVLNAQNEFLLLQRSGKTGAGKKWSLPGGALEDKENPYSSIEREIKEETQLPVLGVKPFSVRTYTNDEKDSVLIICYLCSSKVESVVLNWEHDNYKWITKEAALRLDLTPDGKFFIEHFEGNKV